MRLERKDLFHLFNIKKKKLVKAQQFNKYYSCHGKKKRGLLNKKKMEKTNTRGIVCISEKLIYIGKCKSLQFRKQRIRTAQLRIIF